MCALLEVTNLTKSFANFKLDGVTLTIEPGFIVGLLGVNGSGKTTFLHTLLNLYEKECGEVKVCGYSMETQERLAKEEIGFVLDQNLFEEHLSVRENAKIYGKLYRRYDDELFREFCKHFQVPLKQKVGKLSTGMKTRFQLAFALSYDAKLFIMDEPASGLDPAFRRELMHYMQEIVEDGTRSVLFSTHITEDLEPIGDYITLMQKGKILFSQSIEELRNRYLMLQGTKEQMQDLPFRKVIYKEIGTVTSKAFLQVEPDEQYDDYRSRIPKLEEIMYCLEKGGYRYV